MTVIRSAEFLCLSKVPMTWMSEWSGRADKPASCCHAGATEGDGSCGCAHGDARRPYESLPSSFRRLSVALSLCARRGEKERKDKNYPSSGRKSVMLQSFLFSLAFLNLLACARKPCVSSDFLHLVTGNGVAFTRIQVER